MKNLTTHSIKEQTCDWARCWLNENPLLSSKLALHAALEEQGAVRQGVEETVKFLFLCSITDQTLTPSKRIDDIWHQMILFTRSYETFCNTYLGTFIHHQPSDKPVCEQQQYLATLVLYEQTFGVPDATFWPKPDAHSDGLKADCGACES